jgi:hypothetical protein
MKSTVLNAYIYWFYTDFDRSSLKKSKELIVSIKGYDIHYTNGVVRCLSV